MRQRSPLIWRHNSAQRSPWLIQFFVIIGKLGILSGYLLPSNMVCLHGRVSLRSTRKASQLRNATKLGSNEGIHVGGTVHHNTYMGERPPDPSSLFKSDNTALQERVEMLVDWWQGKTSVFCITGAGLSTESGIPDYRGSKGSYFEGHKPMIHQQFMESDFQRKRYWGRSMVGWSKFDSAQPNKGHFALANLERMGRLGVTVEDRPDFYEPEEKDEFNFSSGQQRVTIVTQNVDSLHQRAGSKNVLQLHGGGSVVKCMNCGKKHGRKDYTLEMQKLNNDWIAEATKVTVEKQSQQLSTSTKNASTMRPDGDAQINTRQVDYNDVHVLDCSHCSTGFLKPDVVFFGDTVPKHRVELCQHAVQAADGILVVGSSLAVHSAFRHIREASRMGIPIAILNVGETRAEVEGLDHITKIEAPAGDVLEGCASQFKL